MKTTAIGIVYAISHIAGETLKYSLTSMLADRGMAYPIVTHEQAKEHYTSAQSLLDLARVILVSIEEIVKQLLKVDQIYIVVSANSVHRAFPELKVLLANTSFAKQVNLVSMIDAAIIACQRHQLRNILVLASSKTISSGLYHQPMTNHGLIPMNLDTHQQALLNTFIDKGIVDLVQDEVDTMLSLIIQSLQSTPVDGILLGCAELKHHLSEKILGTVIIDGSAALEHELLAKLTTPNNS